MGLLRATETCWRLGPTGRVKILIDGQDYFRTLHAALHSARRSIHLLGWSFDPRARLTPDAPDPAEFGWHLNRKVRGVCAAPGLSRRHRMILECKDGSFAMIDVALVIAVEEPRHDVS